MNRVPQTLSTPALVRAAKAGAQTHPGLLAPGSPPRARVRRQRVCPGVSR